MAEKNSFFIKCYYCDQKAMEIAVCNDWGNIPLCGNEACRDKFCNEKYKGSFFVENVDNWVAEDVANEFGLQTIKQVII